MTDKLQALNDEFAAMTKKKKDLEDNIDLCSQKLDRLERHPPTIRWFLLTGDIHDHDFQAPCNSLSDKSAYV